MHAISNENGDHVPSSSSEQGNIQNVHKGPPIDTNQAYPIIQFQDVTDKWSI